MSHIWMRYVIQINAGLPKGTSHRTYTYIHDTHMYTFVYKCTHVMCTTYNSLYMCIYRQIWMSHVTQINTRLPKESRTHVTCHGTQINTLLPKSTGPRHCRRLDIDIYIFVYIHTYEWGMSHKCTRGCQKNYERTLFVV